MLQDQLNQEYNQYKTTNTKQNFTGTLNQRSNIGGLTGQPEQSKKRMFCHSCSHLWHVGSRCVETSLVRHILDTHLQHKVMIICDYLMQKDCFAKNNIHAIFSRRKVQNEEKINGNGNALYP